MQVNTRKANDKYESFIHSEVYSRMAIENGMITPPRRGRAITVRTPGRHSFADTGSRPMLEDVSNEPSEDDLVDLEVDDDSDENEAAPHHDDGEELEMWMRQTRRAHLLTPGQEEEGSQAEWQSEAPLKKPRRYSRA